MLPDQIVTAGIPVCPLNHAPPLYCKKGRKIQSQSQVNGFLWGCPVLIKKKKTCQEDLSLLLLKTYKRQRWSHYATFSGKESLGLVKPDRENWPKITPELLAEKTVEPAGTSPLPERLAFSSRAAWVVFWLDLVRISEPGEMRRRVSLANQGGTTGVPLVPFADEGDFYCHLV
jgi:hypothetical protein